MRLAMALLGMAVVSAPALGQDSAWGYFEGEGGAMQAGVQEAGGAQLILKCDKPGKNSVSAVVYTPEKLLITGRKAFENRPVQLMFDNGKIADESWRFYENVAMAVNQPGERTLPRFIGQLADANSVRVRLSPGLREPDVEKAFTVTGAREAINRVYEACEDDNPLD